MVILTHADMWDVDEADTGIAHLTGYRQYLDKIAENTKAYGMPVLTIVGGSHTSRSDNQLVKSAACVTEPASGQAAVVCNDSRVEAVLTARNSPTDAYLTQPHGYNVNNFHRIVVPGETLPMEWLKPRIDPTAHAAPGPDAFGPFS